MAVGPHLGYEHRPAAPTDEFTNLFGGKVVRPCCKVHWCGNILYAMALYMDEFGTALLSNGWLSGRGPTLH